MRGDRDCDAQEVSLERRVQALEDHINNRNSLANAYWTEIQAHRKKEVDLKEDIARLKIDKDQLTSKLMEARQLVDRLMVTIQEQKDVMENRSNEINGLLKRIAELKAEIAVFEVAAKIEAIDTPLPYGWKPRGANTWEREVNNFKLFVTKDGNWLLQIRGSIHADDQLSLSHSRDRAMLSVENMLRGVLTDNLRSV